jgi:hypothetical protein
MSLLLVLGCTPPPKKSDTKPSCIVHPTSVKEVLKPLDTKDELRVTNGEGDEVVGEYCIVDVFTDSMFLNGDRLELIKKLDALAWEKRALLKAYQHHTELWNQQQKKDFQKILEEDKYLSICGDRRYYDNLLFTTEEPQVDILHSILLLKYLNNLSNGCMKWVTQKIDNENIRKNIQADYLLDMIEKDAIVERLFVPFFPRQKRFLVAIREYKKMAERVEKSKKLKDKRLEIEQLKHTEAYPNYRK